MKIQVNEDKIFRKKGREYQERIDTLREEIRKLFSFTLLSPDLSEKVFKNTSK